MVAPEVTLRYRPGGACNAACVRTHSKMPVHSPICPGVNDGGEAGYCALRRHLNTDGGTGTDWSTWWKYSEIPTPKQWPSLIRQGHFLEEGNATDQSEFENESETVYEGDQEDSDAEYHRNKEERHDGYQDSDSSPEPEPEVYDEDKDDSTSSCGPECPKDSGCKKCYTSSEVFSSIPSTMGCNYECRLHDLVLEEAEERKKWYNLRQRLLAHLHNAPEERPQTQQRLNFVDRQLADQTRRVLDLANTFERGCYRCVPGGKHFR